MSITSPSPKCPLFFLSCKAIQVVYTKENNEPVCGILLLSICVYYVSYIESNGIYNTVMVVIVGCIYG